MQTLSFHEKGPGKNASMATGRWNFASVRWGHLLRRCSIEAQNYLAIFCMQTHSTYTAVRYSSLENSLYVRWSILSAVMSIFMR